MDGRHPRHPDHRIQNDPLLSSFAFTPKDTSLETNRGSLVRLQDVQAYNNSRYLHEDWIAVNDTVNSQTNATHPAPKDQTHVTAP